METVAYLGKYYNMPIAEMLAVYCIDFKEKFISTQNAIAKVLNNEKNRDHYFKKAVKAYQYVMRVSEYKDELIKLTTDYEPTLPEFSKDELLRWADCLNRRTKETVNYSSLRLCSMLMGFSINPSNNDSKKLDNDIKESRARIEFFAQAQTEIENKAKLRYKLKKSFKQTLFNRAVRNIDTDISIKNSPK